MEEQRQPVSPKQGRSESGGRKPFQLHGENIDHAHAEEEARDGDADEGEDGQSVVRPGILVRCGIHAQRDAHHEAEYKGGHGQQQGGRQPFQNHRQHVLPVIGAVSEVPLHQLLQPVPVLDDDRLVQSQLFLGPQQRLAGGSGADHAAQGAARRHLHDEEGQQRDAEHHRHSLQQALSDVFSHGSSCQRCAACTAGINRSALTASNPYPPRDRTKRWYLPIVSPSQKGSVSE